MPEFEPKSREKKNLILLILVFLDFIIIQKMDFRTMWVSWVSFGLIQNINGLV